VKKGGKRLMALNECIDTKKGRNNTKIDLKKNIYKYK
jgi:hypothetical protein